MLNKACTVSYNLLAFALVIDPVEIVIERLSTLQVVVDQVASQSDASVAVLVTLQLQKQIVLSEQNALGILLGLVGGGAESATISEKRDETME
ncbi:hypothetical protein VNO77_02794 [Canavalia gladiata]|uniref:Uncharacterized protein n=1 Tax=Canavalia gladiata TaxID=3824 RepID=A0AAN9MUE3_CANGL